MFNIADIPDLKLIRIENSTNAFTLGQTRTLVHEGPPDRLCFISAIVVNTPTATETAQVTSLKIDDEEILSSASVLASASPTTFSQNAHMFTTPGSATFAFPGMMIPFRRKITITIVNAVAAGDITWEVWAYVHQDRERDFQTVSTLQGQ